MRQNIDVLESALKHEQMGKSLGSIRDAPIGNEHYPTISPLRISGRSNRSEHNPKIGHYTYLRT